MIRRTTGTQRGGIVYILTILMLVLLTSLSMGLVNASGMSAQRSYNAEHVVSARLAGESGMEMALNLLHDFQTPPAKGFVTDILTPIQSHLNQKLGAASASFVPEDPTDPNDWDQVVLSPRLLPGGRVFSLSFRVTAWDSEGAVVYPVEVEMTSTGYRGSITRQVSMRFQVKDNNPLEYGVVSSLRTIVRGNAVIEGPIMSTWGRQLSNTIRNKSTYPLDVDLEEGGRIDGYLGTTLSAADFVGDPNKGDTDFRNGIRHDDSATEDAMRAKIQYNTPPIDTLPTEMFDTSVYRDMTSPANLPTPDATDSDIGVYSVKGNHYEGHDGQNQPALENICLPKGTNARFKNCTFKGIVYIEVDEDTDDPSSSNQNSVIFENCTFEGPIITGVPKKMDWRYNCMQFVGDTVFKKEMIEATQRGVTLLAPNYNVNIGGSEGGGGSGDSELVGLVLGGCVDLYNNLTINGTVVSMAEVLDADGNLNVSPGGSDSWVASSSVCGANVGNLNDTGTIKITPDGENVMPLGVLKRYYLVAKPDSYNG
jgi:hypothetical protein